MDADEANAARAHHEQSLHVDRPAGDALADALGDRRLLAAIDLRLSAIGDVDLLATRKRVNGSVETPAPLDQFDQGS